MPDASGGMVCLLLGVWVGPLGLHGAVRISAFCKVEAQASGEVPLWIHYVALQQATRTQGLASCYFLFGKPLKTVHSDYRCESRDGVLDMLHVIKHKRASPG